MAALFATIFGRLLGRWRGAIATLVAIAIYTVLASAEEAGELLLAGYGGMGD